METIGLGVLMFTVVIILLVAVLMLAKSKLVASGDVTIVINDDPDQTLPVHAGGTLLGALAEQKIFIPSACGGKGSCGVCKVNVTEGGGAMLPVRRALNVAKVVGGDEEGTRRRASHHGEHGRDKTRRPGPPVARPR